MLMAEERAEKIILEPDPIPEEAIPAGLLNRIVKAIREVERETLERAIFAVRQYFADDQERIPAAALPSADECERRIRALMEKPDAE